MAGAAPQSFFVPVETAGEDVSPQADAALATTIEPWIAVARVLGGALEAAHQAVVRTVDGASHLGITNAQLPERAGGFLAEDVACGCRGDTLTGKQDDALRPLGREAGERASVSAGQSLTAGDPSRRLATLIGRERAAVEVRRMNGVNGLR